MKALLDTNILIDYLNGEIEARHEISLYEDAAVSAISWIEVMVGTDEDSSAVIRRWLNQFAVLDIDDSVRERAVLIRKTRSMKLPDAIIKATAEANDRLLVTRNSKDFDIQEPGVRLPYQLA